MTLLVYLVPGLLLGVALNRCGFGSLRRVQQMLALQAWAPLRCLLAALGTGMVLSSFLMWLAVIDVDEVRVLPLHGGVLAGGIIAGAALGLTGISPGISLAAAGSGSLVYGLCGFLGCIAGAAASGWMDGIFESVRGLIPPLQKTVFATTLHHPFLLDGGFLGLACLGAALLTIMLLLPKERRIASEMLSVPAPETIPGTIPETLPKEAFVASLPEEEPIVIDTAADAPKTDAAGFADEVPEDNEEAVRELMLLDGETPPDIL